MMNVLDLYLLFALLLSHCLCVLSKTGVEKKPEPRKEEKTRALYMCMLVCGCGCGCVDTSMDTQIPARHERLQLWGGEERGEDVVLTPYPHPHPILPWHNRQWPGVIRGAWIKSHSHFITYKHRDREYKVFQQTLTDLQVRYKSILILLHSLWKRRRERGNINHRGQCITVQCDRWFLRTTQASSLSLFLPIFSLSVSRINGPLLVVLESAWLILFTLVT